MHLLQHSTAQRFEVWTTYFQENRVRQERLDALIPWTSAPALPAAQAQTIGRSLQRFELGESGDGTVLLAKYRDGDGEHEAALRQLIAEEQKHSALFAGVLDRFGLPRLTSHWSDAAFVALRGMLGFRTEITLFLIAETVALEYFRALDRCPDPVVQGVAQRVLTDEVEHIRFQIDQLRVGFAETARPIRILAAGAAWLVAAGAATVVAVDHGAAMRVCGLRRRTFWRRALGHFGPAAPLAFNLTAGPFAFGPTVPADLSVNQ